MLIPSAHQDCQLVKSSPYEIKQQEKTNNLNLLPDPPVHSLLNKHKAQHNIETSMASSPNNFACIMVRGLVTLFTK